MIDSRSLSFVYRSWSRGLRPDWIGGVVSWAERYRVLPSGVGFEGGPYRVSRAPFWREVMDCLSDGSGISRVVVMKAAQLGATEVGINWLGYVIHSCPGSFLLVCGTRDMARRLIVQRISPLVRGTPELGGLIGGGSAGEGTYVRTFPGGQLLMTWAARASDLRMVSARYLFLDEVDSYPEDVDGEGHPVDLADARLFAAGNRAKALLVSTPTEAGVSRIEREYLGTDRREYHVPCPWCGELQALRWGGLRWDWGRPATVVYVCSACGREIPESKKGWMLNEENGCCWRPTGDPSVVRDAERRGVRGYHVTGLYSPPGWTTWTSIVSRYEAACEREASLRAFWNTVLGLPFSADEARGVSRAAGVEVDDCRFKLVIGDDSVSSGFSDVVWRLVPFRSPGAYDDVAGMSVPPGVRERVARWLSVRHLSPADGSCVFPVRE